MVQASTPIGGDANVMRTLQYFSLVTSNIRKRRFDPIYIYIFLCFAELLALDACTFCLVYIKANFLKEARGKVTNTLLNIAFFTVTVMLTPQKKVIKIISTSSLTVIICVDHILASSAACAFNNHNSLLCCISMMHIYIYIYIYQIYSNMTSNMDDFKTICIYENLPISACFFKRQEDFSCLQIQHF